MLETIIMFILAAVSFNIARSVTRGMVVFGTSPFAWISAFITVWGTIFMILYWIVSLIL